MLLRLIVQSYPLVADYLFFSQISILLIVYKKRNVIDITLKQGVLNSALWEDLFQGKRNFYISTQFWPWHHYSPVTSFYWLTDDAVYNSALRVQWRRLNSKRHFNISTQFLLLHLHFSCIHFSYWLPSIVPQQSIPRHCEYTAERTSRNSREETLKHLNSVLALTS